MSSAEGEELPAKPRRRKAARYFILTVSGAKALVVCCAVEEALVASRSALTVGLVGLETGESITFKRKRRLKLIPSIGMGVAGKNLVSRSRIGGRRPWPESWHHLRWKEPAAVGPPLNCFRTVTLK